MVERKTEKERERIDKGTNRNEKRKRRSIRQTTGKSQDVWRRKRYLLALLRFTIREQNVQNERTRKEQAIA